MPPQSQSFHAGQAGMGLPRPLARGWVVLDGRPAPASSSSRHTVRPAACLNCIVGARPISCPPHCVVCPCRLLRHAFFMSAEVVLCPGQGIRRRPVMTSMALSVTRRDGAMTPWGVRECRVMLCKYWTLVQLGCVRGMLHTGRHPCRSRHEGCWARVSWQAVNGGLVSECMGAKSTPAVHPRVSSRSSPSHLWLLWALLPITDGRQLAFGGRGVAEIGNGWMGRRRGAALPLPQSPVGAD